MRTGILPVITIVSMRREVPTLVHDSCERAPYHATQRPISEIRWFAQLHWRFPTRTRQDESELRHQPRLIEDGKWQVEMNSGMCSMSQGLYVDASM